MSLRLISVTMLALVLFVGVADAKRLRFSGYDFNVKEGKSLGPGPNDWARSQVFVDGKGRLHLKFSETNGRWLAGEIQSISRFGYGTYEIEFSGDIAGQDKNVVFGFFNYPNQDVGPDGTHEIDIEFARWGDKTYPPLNYTVWPAQSGVKNGHKAFNFNIRDGKSRHRFVWRRTSVAYFSGAVKDNGQVGQQVSWTFKPKDPAKQISSKPMPVYFNLWGFKGRRPSDRDDVEVIVNWFKFTPAP